MGHQSEYTDQQDQNSSTVLQVVVQFPGHSAQTQQADHLQRAEQTADALRGRKEGGEGMEKWEVMGKKENGKGEKGKREEEEGDWLL